MGADRRRIAWSTKATGAPEAMTVLVGATHLSEGKRYKVDQRHRQSELQPTRSTTISACIKLAERGRRDADQDRRETAMPTPATPPSSAGA